MLLDVQRKSILEAVLLSSCNGLITGLRLAWPVASAGVASAGEVVVAISSRLFSRNYPSLCYISFSLCSAKAQVRVYV